MQAIAKVTMTVEVPLDQPWGDDCTIGQVLKQAKDSARQKVAKALQGTKIRMMGDCKVSAYLNDMEG
jgi:hypothetical protein